jgi:hypothetical protein
MNRRSVFALVLAFAAVLGPLPARAGSASGACLMTIRMTFPAPVTNNTPPMPLQSSSGSGTCATTAQPLSPLKTITMTAADPLPGLFTRCDLLQVNGYFTIDWSPDPAPAPNDGVFNFYGTAAGGVLHMSGSSPTLEGIGVLVGTGLTGCVLNGAQTLTFTAVLPFVDP